MAGDWIKMRRGLRHDPKVVAIARFLASEREFMNWWTDPQRMSCRENVTEVVTFSNVTRVTVCALLDVWAALNNTIRDDGRAPFMALIDLDDIAEIPRFGAAMESVGWVVQDESQGLYFPNFSENNTPSRNREAPKTNAERQKAFRDRKRAEKESEKEALRALRNVTGEKRREENIEGSHNAREPEGVSPQSPTLAEIQGYAARNMIAADVAAAFFDSMEAVGWLDAKGRLIRSPEHALKRWAANWAEIKARTPAARAAAPETKQPFDPAKGFWQQGTPSQIREREKAEREARAKEEVA